jgi:hypothetical protein
MLLGLFFCLAPIPAARAAQINTDWSDVAETGLSGVSFALLELPSGELRAYWMGGEHGMAAATSSDGGLTWTMEQDFNPPRPGPDQVMTSNPWVFLTTDNRFRMIYEIQDQDRNRRLYSAISDDGLNFQPEGIVMSGDQDDMTQSPNPEEDSVIFLSVPTGLRLADGGLRMYFVSAGDRIRSAVSRDDGLTWERDAGVRMLDAVDPCLTTLPNGGYRMFYVDWREEYRTKRIWFADSLDGLTFVEQGLIAWTEDKDTALIDPEIYIAPQGSPRLFYSFGAWDAIGIYTAVAPADWSREIFPLKQPEQ